jgi:hypothetical protein
VGAFLVVAYFFTVFLVVPVTGIWFAILLVRDAACDGLLSSIQRHRFGLLYLVILIGYQLGNFTGFCWSQHRFLTNREIIDAAIQDRGMYRNLDEMRKDYPNFMPIAEYWGNWDYEATHFANKWTGRKTFQVRLPDDVVMVDCCGKAEFSRSCGSNSAYCSVIPKHRN